MNKAKLAMNRAMIFAAAVVMCAAFSGCSKSGKETCGGGMTKTKASVGKPAPDFNLKSLDGKDFSLARDAKGKLTLVTFYATWCKTCGEEIPLLNKLHEQLGPKGLLIVGVDSGDAPDFAKKFAKKQKMRYLVLVDEAGEVAVSQYGFMGLPGNVVVGRDGKVLYKNTALPKDTEKYFTEALSK